jgi:hypothetical protein
MKRTLRLDRDTLTELTTDELSQAVAGLSGPTCVGATCPAVPCMTQRLGCYDLTHNCF